ncbi:outer membrane protein [Microbulbifer sp. SSSA002]|uniref:outer membrane protein n=1 Tax=Microbulbifer sp. SSSA002 TaxID=3243376 RepID=UPI00403A697C
MRFQFAAILGASLISVQATAAGYSYENSSLSFHPFVSLNAGYNKLEVNQDYRGTAITEDGDLYGFSYYELSSSDSELWSSFAIGADFDNYPLELRISYGTTSSEEPHSIDTFDIDAVTDVVTIVERYNINQKYDLDVFSITGVLELSKHCGRACMYLLGGYSFGQLDWSYTMNELYGGGRYQGSKKFSKSYLHVGAGVRYNLTDSLRMSAEYMLHNIGKLGDYDVNDYEHVEFDMKNLDIWQAGVSYTF